jgi:dolichol-phosphate mannosyltransferase
MKPMILVCIPTYNEVDNIIPLTQEILAKTPDWVHILVADDNSPDGTARVLAHHLGARLHILNRPGKQGLGKAYLGAFAWGLAKGYQGFIEMDADFSHRPDDLVKLIEEFQKDDIDFAIGSRYIPGGRTVNWGILRKIISRGGSLYARLILGFPVSDWTGGFNAYQRRVFEKIALDDVNSTGYSFQIELKYRSLLQGFRFREVPIVFEDRRVGQSKMSSGIVFEALLKVWALRWKLS